MIDYMDDSYIIVGNTIITYTGRASEVKTPAYCDDTKIAVIGSGAFMESDTLESVIIPAETNTISPQAFCNCPYLKRVSVHSNLVKVGFSAFNKCDSLSEIIIRDIQLTEHEYHAIKNNGIRSNGGIYVLRNIPPIILAENLIASIYTAHSACMVPEGISALFQMSKLDETNGTLSLDEEKNVIGFSIPSVPISENNAFRNHIKNPTKEYYDQKAEEKNDWFVRVDKIPAREKTVIFTFDDTKTKLKGGRFIIEAALKIGYFFWQSAQTVMYDGTQYYIYRRHYLSADAEKGYVRRDIALYSEKGLVKDIEVAKNVYAKYKLMSML